MEDGVEVCLPSRYSSDLVYVRDAASDRPEGFAVPGLFTLESPNLQSEYFGANADLSWSFAEAVDPF